MMIFVVQNAEIKKIMTHFLFLCRLFVMKSKCASHAQLKYKFQTGDNIMKKRLIFALIMTMALCSCGKEETHQRPNHSSSATTTTAVSAEATTAAQEAADTTAPDADTAAITTTAAAENTNTETTTAADASAETTDAAYESAGSHVNLDLNDPFAGQFFDENNSNFSMVLDNIGNGYKVNISRKVSDTQIDNWYITGQFDGRAVLHYDNCSKYIVTLGENGSTTSTETVYTNGTGYISISERGADDTGYVWSDDVDNAGSGAFFKK